VLLCLTLALFAFKTMAAVESFKISGKSDRHTFVNGDYQVMSQRHNGQAVYVARSVKPAYIFHTGKARWVVGKRVDDGFRCYMFIKCKGQEADPTKCDGDWVVPQDDDQWGSDPNISCKPVPGSNDVFVKLRMSVEPEMKQLGITDVSKLKVLWRRLDYNGNNIVSLAEIDKMVVEMVAGGMWPAWLNNKPALMRAYKKTILKDGDGDDWVEKNEFAALLLNIFWFNRLFQMFQAVDSGADRRMDFQEFFQGMGKLGLQMDQQQAQAEFNKIDGNSGGQVLFVEFCAYVRKRVNPDDDPSFDADIISGTKCSVHMKKMQAGSGRHHRDAASLGGFVKKKTISDFDDVEAKFKKTINNLPQLRELWHRIDFNGNNIVSLAEIDKFVVELYPVLNHKPALMRAYKATINSEAADGDDWVDKKEFKMLLANLVFFNKLFWLFDNVDGDKDRRMNFQEFKECCCFAGCQMNESQLQQEFRSIDRNGGGIVLFDEFCLWFTKQRAPEAFEDSLGGSRLAGGPSSTGGMPMGQSYGGQSYGGQSQGAQSYSGQGQGQGYGTAYGYSQ